jgi:acyl-CoA synthetase (AMP-forming)/AMP-acid ligase II
MPGAKQPSASTILEAVAVRAGERTALSCPDDGRSWSFDQMLASAENLASEIASAGVQAGQCVAFSLPQGPETVILFLAVTALGAAAAPLNPAYTQTEFEFYFADLEPALLVVPERGGTVARKAWDQRASLRSLRLGSGHELDLQARERPAGTGADNRRSPRSSDVALLLHTSGTTSGPKQVPLLQRNVLASCHALADHYRLSSLDRSLCVMPLFHVHGLVGACLSTLVSGGTAVVPRRLGGESLVNSLADATWLTASPTLHRMLLERMNRKRAFGREKLRFLRSCSSALPPDLLAEAEGFFDVPMIEAYGMTEASHQISSNPLPPGQRRLGSVGVPTGIEVSILTGAGGKQQEGQLGEVAIRGPSVTPGYRDPERRGEGPVESGWFLTGDIGLLDAEGYLYLHGRLKEMILRGGENISPYEIEQVLASHPTVLEAACFGIPDRKYGEIVGAAVVATAECAPGDLNRHCQEHLAAFKVPARVWFVDSFPKTITGKIQRTKLRSSLLNEE